MSLVADQLFSLSGKTVLLTGAAGFLGRTFGRAVLENDGRLIALGRSGRLTEQVAQWAEEFGDNRVSGYVVDMYDISRFEALLDQLVIDEEFIDVVINNAHELGPSTGFNTSPGGLEGASYDEWMRNLTAGVYWSAATVRRIGPMMKERRKGSIINISTMYALVAPSPQLYEGTTFMNPPGYSAAKAGLLAFTRYVASFWGEYGIRSNAILPGPFSNTQEQGTNSVPEDDPFLERLRQRTCLNRVGRPEELVGAMLFLASDASSFVTGHGLVVDGGWTAT